MQLCTSNRTAPHLHLHLCCVKTAWPCGLGAPLPLCSQVRGAAVADFDRKRRARCVKDGVEGERARAVANGDLQGNGSAEVTQHGVTPRSPMLMDLSIDPTGLAGIKMLRLHGACWSLLLAPRYDHACSPHVHKKAREQLEARTHRRLVQIRAEHSGRHARTLPHTAAIAPPARPRPISAPLVYSAILPPARVAMLALQCVPTVVT